MASIEALFGDQTILMISHCLSIVKLCDWILVMEADHVSDVSSWDELIARNAAFRPLAEAPGNLSIHVTE